MDPRSKRFRPIRPNEIVERGDFVRRFAGSSTWSEVVITMIGRAAQNFPEHEFQRCHLSLVQGGVEDDAEVTKTMRRDEVL